MENVNAIALYIYFCLKKCVHFLKMKKHSVISISFSHLPFHFHSVIDLLPYDFMSLCHFTVCDLYPNTDLLNAHYHASNKATHEQKSTI